MINCGDCCLFSCGGATVYDKGNWCYDMIVEG